VIGSSDDYNLKPSSGFSKVVFEEVNESPDCVPYPYQVAFTAGYGATASTVPDPIKLAIKQIVAYWYKNRGDCGKGDELPGTAKALLREYRIINTYG